MFSIKPLSYSVSLPHCVSVKLYHVEIPFVGRYFWFLLFFCHATWFCIWTPLKLKKKIKKRKKPHALYSVTLLWVFFTLFSVSSITNGSKSGYSSYCDIYFSFFSFLFLLYGFQWNWCKCMTLPSSLLLRVPLLLLVKLLLTAATSPSASIKETGSCDITISTCSTSVRLWEFAFSLCFCSQQHPWLYFLWCFSAVMLTSVRHKVKVVPLTGKWDQGDRKSVV